MEAFSAQSNTECRREARAPGRRHHDRAAAFRLSRSKRAGRAAVRLVRAFARPADARGSRSSAPRVRGERPRAGARGTLSEAASPQSCGIEAPTSFISTKRSRRMRGSAQVPSSRWPSDPPLPRLKGSNLEPEEIAARLGRGLVRASASPRSPKAASCSTGGRARAVARTHQPPALPADWRVLLIFERRASGLAGANETAAFDTLPDFRRARPRSFRGAVTQARCRRSPQRFQNLLRAGRLICRPAWAPISRRCKAAPMPARGSAPRWTGCAARGSPGLARVPGGRPALPLWLRGRGRKRCSIACGRAAASRAHLRARARPQRRRQDRDTRRRNPLSDRIETLCRLAEYAKARAVKARDLNRDKRPSTRAKP